MIEDILSRIVPSGRSRRVAFAALVALMVVIAGCGGAGPANNTTDGDGGVNATDEETVDAGNDTDGEDNATDGEDNVTDNATDNATGNATDNATGNATGEMANLRVAHMSPDAPAVDVYVNDEPFVEGVEYGNVSNYTEVESGEYNVTITAAGEEDQVVYAENVTVADRNYTVAAIGELGDIEAVGDDANDTNATGNDSAGENDTNSSENSSESDSDASAADGEENATEETPVEDPENEPFQVIVLEDAETLDDGLNATDDAADNATETDANATGNESADENVTDENATETETVETNDTETDAAEANASVRFVHASPDAGPVDIVDAETGDPVAENVRFGEPTEYVEVPAGDYTLEIVPVEDDEEPVETVDVTVEAETPYTAFAAGYVSDDAPVDAPLEVFVVPDGPDAAMMNDSTNATDDGAENGTEETTTEADNSSESYAATPLFA